VAIDLRLEFAAGGAGDMATVELRKNGKTEHTGQYFGRCSKLASSHLLYCTK
jgi:hypothetical protein